MGLFDFFKRMNKKLSNLADDDSLEIKKEESTSLYGGLCALKAGFITLEIGVRLLEFAELLLEGSPGYSYAHDWEGKRRLTRFKWHFQRRRAWQRHNRDGRVSLKQLGWRVVNLET